MKRSFFSILVSVFLISGLMMHETVNAQNDKSLTKKEASQWFNGKKWMNGLLLKPHSSIDKQELANEYHKHQEWWDKAFAFMKDASNGNLAPGTYPIDGDNVFAKVTEIPSKDFNVPKWEAHRNYYDIHYVITGKEKIGIGSLSDATEVEAYNSTRDITFYNGKGKYYVAAPGEFFIMSPQKTHRPSIKVSGYDVVKKIVIKVRCK